MSAEDVWWSPALVARVCRFWREVALATPRTWSFINLRSGPPLAFASAFFERSSQCLLHVTVPIAPDTNPTSYATVVGRITNRIECLVLTRAAVALFSYEFPHLTRLCITYPLTPIPLECLTMIRFPNLRYINGHFSTSATIAPFIPSTSPPIERLIVSTDRHSAWISAILSFSKTLKALHISIEDAKILPAYPSLELPKVVHLAMSSGVSRRSPWNFMAKTPALKIYSTIEGDGVHSANVDVASVTHLQSWEPISLLPYTKLRQIHVYGYNTDPRTALVFIDQLCGDYGSTCHHFL